MTEPDNFILTLMREMRREISERFDKVDAKLVEHDRRFESLGQAINGESVLGRYAAHEVDERLSAIEKRLDAIEGRR